MMKCIQVSGSPAPVGGSQEHSERSHRVAGQNQAQGAWGPSVMLNIEFSNSQSIMTFPSANATKCISLTITLSPFGVTLRPLMALTLISVITAAIICCLLPIGVLTKFPTVSRDIGAVGNRLAEIVFHVRPAMRNDLDV